MNGVILAALAALCWAIEAILVKKGGSELNPIIGSALGNIVSGAIFLVYLIFTRNFNKAFFHNSTIYFMLAGIISLLFGRVFYFQAINKIGASLSVAISSTYPMIAVILSFLFFKEPISLRMIVGIVMVSFGGILLII